MAAADPASHSCKDTPGPGHSLSEGCSGWHLFLIYGMRVCSCQRSNRAVAGGPTPIPLLQITGGLRNNTCTLTACGPSAPDKCTDCQGCITAEDFHIHF